MTDEPFPDGPFADRPATGGPLAPDPAGGAELPYGTARSPRVAVRGEALIEVDPEVARIGITVSARGTDRRTALEDLTRRNTAALELVKSYGDAVEKLETGAFSISPQLTRHGKGERVRAYQGRVHISAELADFTALGELTTRLADLELVQVDGPWWGLRPDSPAHAEARRQAVREAVQRAREYAGALGTELAALVELADLGAENAVPYAGPPAPGSARMAFAGAAAEAAPALDLEPQRQTVTAQVNARFTMHPPKL
ncbi:SIMPL domain-containing protein [Streptomyces sp. LP05-1]|uniref:SIMPL domain-containing protein n=1 Tax=Streptomyces pyxinae TaxID=2970734 RepID=A0ABT2CJC4_9ACTN|nr:SIMPL domain-containing protein [Streptomyces sp. LP05-1]MCS0637395.1 SIMPL domain-containing protein [Streptomyces sp. LP05-1]